jgi:hypothetical protein
VQEQFQPLASDTIASQPVDLTAGGGDSYELPGPEDMPGPPPATSATGSYPSFTSGRGPVQRLESFVTCVEPNEGDSTNIANIADFDNTNESAS